MRESAFKSALRLFALFAAGFVVSMALRDYDLPGGDTPLFLSHQWDMIYSRPDVWFAREPFAHASVLLLYRLTDNLILAFQLNSAIWCGVFLVVVDRFGRGWRLWLPVLLSIGTWNFIGHLEYYAPVLVALALYYLALVRALAPRPAAGPAHVAAAFALAFLMHKAALFFLPAALWLVFRREDGRWRPRPWPRRSWEWALAWLIIPGLLEVAAGIAGLSQTVFYVNVNEPLRELITPFNQAMADWVISQNATGMFYYFHMFEPLHAAHFFGFLLAGAPLGLPLLLVLRRRLRGDAACALLTAALLGAVWLFFWHPRGAWKDWDLFSLATLPINLLAGLAWSGGLRRSGSPTDPAISDG